MGGINLLASFELGLSNVQHMPGAVVEQLDNLLVQMIDRFAMVGNIHEGFFTSAPVDSSAVPAPAELVKLDAGSPACWPSGLASCVPSPLFGSVVSSVSGF